MLEAGQLHKRQLLAGRGQSASESVQCAIVDKNLLIVVGNYCKTNYQLYWRVEAGNIGVIAKPHEVLDLTILPHFCLIVRVIISISANTTRFPVY